jgi:hypothetical protein
MRRVRHVASIGNRKGAYRVLVGNVKERDHLEDPGLDEIILRWIFRKFAGWGGAWTMLI